MLEWVCPKCRRAVHPGRTTCPFCGQPSAAESSPAPSPAPRARGSLRRRFTWADADRGFRFGLGLVAVLAVVYFVLFVAAYVTDHSEWIDRLTRWLR